VGTVNVYSPHPTQLAIWYLHPGIPGGGGVLVCIECYATVCNALCHITIPIVNSVVCVASGVIVCNTLRATTHTNKTLRQRLVLSREKLNQTVVLRACLASTVCEPLCGLCSIVWLARLYNFV